MKTYWMTTLGLAGLLSLSACGGQDAQPEDSTEQAGATPVSVRAVEVQPRQLQSWTYSQGTARSRQREFLTFTQQGMVTYVDESLRVGRPVKQGQIIAHQAPERVQADFQAARAALAEAQASLRLAEVTQQRYETLARQRSASKQELDEATVQVQQARASRDNARAQLAQAQVVVDESRLRSPIDGVLARLNVEKGRYFSPNTVQGDTEQNALRTVPALVIDPDRFEVRVDLPAYDFRRIEVGAPAVIGSNPPVSGADVDPMAHTRSAGPDERADAADVRMLKGRVHAISPSLDPETRTFEVIIHTDDMKPRLQDGEFVAAWIAEPAGKDVVAVPMDAVRFRNDQAFVFVLDRETRKVGERRLELGQQAGAYRAVLDGLEPGEWVVTEGRAALQDGQEVQLLGAAEQTQ